MRKRLIEGDALEELKELPSNSIEMIFADPPYNLSDKENVSVHSGERVVLDKGEWDQISDLDKFNLAWLKECKRILKEEGTIWISGTLHNHPSIGWGLRKLDMWIINDIVWFKNNAPPLLSANRFVPSTEIIWFASTDKNYFFNYEKAKKINNGKQMRNLWKINAEKHKTEHPTEKPEKLLRRIISVGSEEGDTILDPFFGSGTTGVVAKKLNRNFIGIEKDSEYFEIGKERIEDSEEGSLLSENNLGRYI